MVLLPREAGVFLSGATIRNSLIYNKATWRGGGIYVNTTRVENGAISSDKPFKQN